jgi:hypothetical protein
VVPRLKTAIWVDAFLRQATINGQYGAVLHKGAEEAGSILLVVNHLDGNHDLLAPPPGPAYGENGTRRFLKLNKSAMDWPSAAERIAKLRKSDPDLWVVEVEDRTGFGGATVETDSD